MRMIPSHIGINLYRLAAAAFLGMCLAPPAIAPARAQERFSPFVPSNEENVERMIKLANLRPTDTVMDLGSGDGRIVIAAAKSRAGVKGIGVEINEELAEKSTDAVHAQGLADRVRIVHQNAFDAELKQADVIFMWLFPELMRLLRPKILAEARPGTRVVAASWDMGAWWPADTADDSPNGPTIRMWIVPARIEGEWEWDLPIRGATRQYRGLFEQRMQQAEGAVRVGVRREGLSSMLLRGDQLQFRLNITLPGAGYAMHTFTGRVIGERIEGTVMVQMTKPGSDEDMETMTLPWTARRSTTPGYFAPTGTRF